MKKALKMVELPNMGNRRPGQLSGGQQQRIAVARALVFEPDLVLMDEPLGALDKQLREQMQYEIKHIHERLGVTVVYVTHDQSRSAHHVEPHRRVQRWRRAAALDARTNSTNGRRIPSSPSSSARTTS